MIADEIRQQLRYIVEGISFEESPDGCKTVRNLLSESFGTDSTVKREFEGKARRKEEQQSCLNNYAQQNNLWLPAPTDNFLARGGESRVFLSADGRNVIKLNDGGYYATWTEYFNNLVIHNLLFPGTAYNLIGFTMSDNQFCVMLEQPFIEGGQADLGDIEAFLTFNDFKKFRRQDYYNTAFRLMLEDMHDENVIAKEGLLFFIDTVFYILGENEPSPI